MPIVAERGIGATLASQMSSLYHRLSPYSGTPDEVYFAAHERIETLGIGGGRFEFNATHNVQPNGPPDNMWSMFRTVRDA